MVRPFGAARGSAHVGHRRHLRGARRRGLVHRWAVARYAGRDPVGAGGQRLPPRPGGRRPGRRRAGSRRTTEARHGRSPTPGLAAQRPDGRAHCASMCRYARPVSGFLVAVDYGTLNTVAVLRRPDGQVRPLLFDGSPLLPSAVCLGPDGRLLVGRDAENAARLDPAALVLDPRSHIDAGTMAVGRASFPVAEVIAATLTRVAREAIQHAGGVLPRLALTHPAAWDERRQATLTEAGFRSGLGVATLVPRPVAAASYHTASSGDIGLGRCLLVYDLGAGSFEASLLRRSADGYDILAAKALDDFGGLDLDSLLIETIERAMAPSPPEAWRRLVAPTTAAERRQFTQLCADVRSAKEALSRQLAVGLHIPLVEQDVRIGREEFESAAEPRLARTVGLAADLLTATGTPTEQVGEVLLLGGSSRIPLVTTLLYHQFGFAPTACNQPELAVAEGALTVVSRTPVAPLEPTEPATVELTGLAPLEPTGPAPRGTAPTGPARGSTSTAPTPTASPSTEPTSPAAPTGPPPVAVSVTVNPTSGTCSTDFTFVAHFTVNEPRKYRWHWVLGGPNQYSWRSGDHDRDKTGDEHITKKFDAAGSGTYWALVQVTSPVTVTSSPATVEVICNR